MIFTTAIPAAALWVLGLPAIMVYITRCSGGANDGGDKEDGVSHGSQPTVLLPTLPLESNGAICTCYAGLG